MPKKKGKESLFKITSSILTSSILFDGPKELPRESEKAVKINGGENKEMTSFHESSYMLCLLSKESVYDSTALIPHLKWKLYCYWITIPDTTQNHSPVACAFL